MDRPLIVIARFRNAQDKQPRQQSGTWESLARRLTRHTERTEKDGPLWSPTIYRPGTTRGKANVEWVTCLCLDFDDGSAAERFTAGWDRYAYAMHTTHSHSDEHPKWRVVFPFLRPVAAAEWPDLWQRLVRHFGGNAVDKQCKDASRIYYLPACAPGAPRAAHEHGGEWLNPDDYARPEPELLLMRAKDRLHEGRNAAGMWLGCQMRDNGYTQSEVERVAWHLEVPAEKLNGNGTVDAYTEQEWLDTVRKVFGRPAREAWSLNGATTETTKRQNSHSVVSVVPSLVVSTSQPPEEMEPEAYYGLAGDCVNAISPHSESDPAAILASFLVAAGCLFGRGPHVYRDGARHCTNEFACLVGRSAVGRKGTATRRTDEIFCQVDSIDYKKNKNIAHDMREDGPEYDQPAIWPMRQVQGLGSGEGLIWSLAEPDDLLDWDSRDRRRIVFEEEFARPLAAMRREGCTLSAIIRAAWDGSTLASRTKGRLLEASGAHVAILGHITEIELRSQLKASELFNGFANRFLWFCTKRSKSLPFGGGVAPTGEVVHGLQVALRHASETGQVEFDDGTKALWAEGGIYDRLIDRPRGLLGSVTGRAEAHVTRLALLYALLDWTRTVRVEHLLAALAVWDYSERSCAYLFGHSTGDEYADTIAELLAEHYPGGVSRTQIRDAFGRNAPAGRIPAALALLEAEGRARMVSMPSEKGRSTELWGLPESGYDLRQNDRNDKSPLALARSLIS